MSSYHLTRLRRVFDDRPIACHLYVTDRCNLDCHYCTEFDNSAPHPDLDDLKRWITKIRELGCIRIGLQGGEPLLHPDIVEIVRHCAQENGLVTSMSTNGFPLTEELIQQLEDAGLRSIHVSVDRMTPIDSTRKSLKTVAPKLDMLRRSGLKWNLSGVLFEESVYEARQVLEYGFANDVHTQARLVHAGTDGAFSVHAGAKEPLRELLHYQRNAKRAGLPAHSASAIITYQERLLDGDDVDWTCLAGNKFFFVSASGDFWLCSMNRAPGIPIMDVTPDMLRSYAGPKKCQTGCGVYCTVGESLFNSHPVAFLADEANDRVRGAWARRRGRGAKAPSQP